LLFELHLGETNSNRYIHKGQAKSRKQKNRRKTNHVECAAQRRAISYPMTEVIGMVDGFDLTLTRCPAVASIRRIEKDLIGMSQLEIPVCLPGPVGSGCGSTGVSARSGQSATRRRDRGASSDFGASARSMDVDTYPSLISLGVRPLHYSLR
jgi:hypothetical protein